MATKHKGLGRGLDALLSGDQSEPESPRSDAAPLTLPLDQLKPGARATSRAGKKGGKLVILHSGNGHLGDLLERLH